MKDIFISYSSSDIEFAKRLDKRFSEIGLSCWTSYSFEDIAPGENYTERIPDAIRSSKVFILLASVKSLASEQVKSEINIANNQRKYGLNLICILLDEQLTAESLGGGADYVFATSQTGHWNDEDYLLAVEKTVTTWLCPPKITEKVDIVSVLPADPVCVGRDTDLFNLEEQLHNYKKVCLWGMGGIGKTILVKSLLNRFSRNRQYTNLIYIPVSNGLLRSLASDDNLLFKGDHIKSRASMTDYEYAFYKLNLLESSIGKESLIVLDNMESDKDPLFERVISLQCNMILSCRNPSMREYTESSYLLKEIKDQQYIKKVFEIGLGRPLNNNEQAGAESLFRKVKNHTLSLVLLGKWFSYYGVSPSDAKKSTYALFSKANRRKKNPSDHINQLLYDLFDARSLTADEISVLKAMCLVPEKGISGILFEQLLGQECVEELLILKQKGWIQPTDDLSMVCLHPVVKEIVINELGIDINDPELQTFAGNFFNRISKSREKLISELLPYKELALTYYYFFQTPSQETYSRYLTLANYFWNVNCPDIGIEIMEKVKALYINPDGSHKYTSQEAEVLLQIGFIYHGNGEYSKAADHLALAARIFANKYGAALSHLGQAKMYLPEETIESVEPLMKESLRLREKYWHESISEASSYHLYAKVLSKFECKLDDAIRYEKKAESFFSKKQEGGRNDSSAKYILGWLFVQKANGNVRLIEHGIDLLETAKEMRINNTGADNIWMEDIYRKLGQAYEKKEDYEKARINYEALLNVAVNKYSPEKSHPVIIETYKYLSHVYRQLNEDRLADEADDYILLYG